MAISRDASSNRWAKAICFAAFVVTVAASAAKAPFGQAFGYSDHFTHMNAARLFPRVGLALWRAPIDSLFPESSASDVAAAPADVRAAGTNRMVPGWPSDKPFVGGWTHLARPYPPGDLLVVAPVAALYHFTPLSFTMACHLLIATFLAFAHVAAYFAWRDAPQGAQPRLYLASATVAYVYMVYWTSRGFYDAVAAVPLVLAASYLGSQRWLAVVVAFSIAFFCHYRALFFAPWALFASLQLARDRAWRAWAMADWLATACAMFLGLSALTTFVLIMPTLGNVPFENPIHPGHMKAVPVTAFACTALFAIVAFVRLRAGLDVAMLVWLAIMLVSARQVQAWHAILLFPWIFSPAEKTFARVARVQFVAIVTVAVIL